MSDSAEIQEFRPETRTKISTSLASQLAAYRSRDSQTAPSSAAAPAVAEPVSAQPQLASPATSQAPTTSAVPEPAAERLSPEERALLDRALSGVTPLSRGKRARIPRARAVSRNQAADAARDDLVARARLGALVGGGTSFHVERDSEGSVQGRRSHLKPRILDRFYSARWQPQARIDLHGYRSQEAAVALARFVRAQWRRGTRRLLVVHGKGIHSEGGIGVLDDVVLQALTQGGAAPHVAAFATARRELGGGGALMVELADAR